MPTEALTTTSRSKMTIKLRPLLDFDEPSGFWPEMYKCDLLYKMVIHMKELDFEPKKDARLIFVQALQRKAGSKHPTADYIARKVTITQHFNANLSRNVILS